MADRPEAVTCMVVLGAVFATLLASAGAQAQDLVVVNAFPQAKTLPLHAGIAKGIFRAHAVAVDLHLTENSRSQRDGLAAGQFDVVHSAVDNALAMVEIGKHDVVIVAGGDSGMNELFVQPEITSIADLRGKRLVVDAPDTAYALQAIKILKRHGLVAGRDYVIDAVEHAGKDYRSHRLVEIADNGEADAGQPDAHRRRGDRVGHQPPQRQPAAHAAGFGLVGRLAHWLTPSISSCWPSSASTVSPATTFCPISTFGSVPAGR